MNQLLNLKVAILTDDGFEEIELTYPRKILEDEGANVDIVSRKDGKVKGWGGNNWSVELDVDIQLAAAKAESYDALMIPGGVINPDKMRIEPLYISFVQHFIESGKPVAAICHGPQLLIETGMLQGRELTSAPAIKTDLINAGAYWHDKEVVVDNGLVTSRSPEDLEAFTKKMVEEFKEGIHLTKASFTNTTHP